MDDRTIEARLDSLRQQAYPLSLDEDAADALVECIRRIMALVPEDDRIFVRADYDSATSAILHPPTEPPYVTDEESHFHDH